VLGAIVVTSHINAEREHNSDTVSLERTNRPKIHEPIQNFWCQKGREFHAGDSQIVCAMCKIESSRLIGARALFTHVLCYSVICSRRYKCALKFKVRDLYRNYKRHRFTVLLTISVT